MLERARLGEDETVPTAEAMVAAVETDLWMLRSWTAEGAAAWS